MTRTPFTYPRGPSFGWHAAFAVPGLVASASLAVVAFGACSSPPEPVTPPAPASAPPVVSAAPSSAPIASAEPVPTMTATAAPTAAPEAKPPARCPDKMALVAGGTYAWGPKKENVTVADFCMDVSETTSDTYAACVKEKKCTEDFLKCAPQQTYGVAGKGNAPVVCVDLKQANDFCAYAGKRLPSEEEWEWAARGGKNGWKFPWGDDAPKDQLCWAGLGDKPKGPCDVGAHPKGDSPEGIHDLAGNVFEWTTSRNDATSPVRDGRGGSWKDGDPALLRANRAGAFQPSYRCGFLGIRCVMKAN